jgi:hypothetical protein
MVWVHMKLHKIMWYIRFYVCDGDDILTRILHHIELVGRCWPHLRGWGSTSTLKMEIIYFSETWQLPMSLRGTKTRNNIIMHKVKLSIHPAASYIIAPTRKTAKFLEHTSDDILKLEIHIVPEIHYNVSRF